MKKDAGQELSDAAGRGRSVPEPFFQRRLEDRHIARRNKASRSGAAGKWTTGSVGGEVDDAGPCQKRAALWRRRGGLSKRAASSFVKGNINASGQISETATRDPQRTRVCALAVSALGYDARSFAGHDLLAAMADTAWVTKQGNNASAFALLAMNAKTAYLAGDEALQRAAETLVKSLVDKQNPDGGWANTTETATLTRRRWPPRRWLPIARDIRTLRTRSRWAFPI